MTRARILADYVAGGTTAAEFDYLDGVTSNVQTQMDAKAPLASPTFTGTANLSSGVTMPAGHIIQVKHGTTSGASSGTSHTNWVDCGSLAITPASTSNKIYIMVTGVVGPTINGSSGMARGYTAIWHTSFTNDGSNNIGYIPLVGFQNFSYSNGGDAYFRAPLQLAHLHSPSTTSSITYGYAVRRTGSSDEQSRSEGNITLLEIQG